jgi:hypothetical protein
VAVRLQKIPLNEFVMPWKEVRYWRGKPVGVKISEDFNAKTVFERFADNFFLPKFL